jgi:hypothetical protein
MSVIHSLSTMAVEIEVAFQKMEQMLIMQKNFAVQNFLKSIL